MTKLNENNVTYVIQTMSSMNDFDSSKKYLTCSLKLNQWKSIIMEMHSITKSTNLHVNSSFPTVITRCN